jgi:predicted nucleic acid-binding protein
VIVVDTNVIAYLYLSSDRAVRAEQALLRDSEWAAPLLWRSEMRSVLSLYIRRQRLTLAAAQQVMAEATRLMRDREYAVPSEQVLTLIASSACSAYDCEFVALATDLHVRLVTTDRQILGEYPNVAVSLDDYAAGR